MSKRRARRYTRRPRKRGWRNSKSRRLEAEARLIVRFSVKRDNEYRHGSYTEDYMRDYDDSYENGHGNDARANERDVGARTSVRNPNPDLPPHLPAWMPLVQQKPTPARRASARVSFPTGSFTDVDFSVKYDPFDHTVWTPDTRDNYGWCVWRKEREPASLGKKSCQMHQHDDALRRHFGTSRS